MVPRRRRGLCRQPVHRRLGNNRIRKVSNGVITTVAGNGTPSFSGDNGPATSAQLYDPVGVAVDSAGNLYIADRANNRIRKVSNGVITTVAGNGTQASAGTAATTARPPAPSCAFPRESPWTPPATCTSPTLEQPHPQGLERGDHHCGGKRDARLQRRQRPGHQRPVVLSLRRRRGLCRQPVHRRLRNNRIRKVSNGVITTVAGNGTPGFSGDNGPATSAELCSRQGGRGLRRQPVHRRYFRC